jgi:hypothetical protein
MLRSSLIAAALTAASFGSIAGHAQSIQNRPVKQTAPGHHYIVQPRSSRVTPHGHRRTGQIPSGAPRHNYARGTFRQPTPIHGTFAAPRWW